MLHTLVLNVNYIAIKLEEKKRNSSGIDIEICSTG